MGVEFLTEGQLHVLRPDAPKLVAIKNCEWTLDQVKDEAKRLFGLADEAYVRSGLPNEPDTKRAEELLISIIEETLEGE